MQTVNKYGTLSAENRNVSCLFFLEKSLNIIFFGEQQQVHPPRSDPSQALPFLQSPASATTCRLKKPSWNKKFGSMQRNNAIYQDQEETFIGENVKDDQKVGVAKQEEEQHL